MCFLHFCRKTIFIMRFLSIHPVQSVVNSPTQLSGRGFPCIFYMKLCVSQLYVVWFSKREAGSYKLTIYKFENSNYRTSLFFLQIFKTQYFTLSKFKAAFVQITRPGVHFEVPKNIQLRQKHFHMKDTGKSSSRKLRRAIYHTLYRMDPQNTH